MTITVSCPSCATSFPVDPAKIPEGGVKARCSTCANVFRVEKPAQFDAPEAAGPTPDEVSPAPEATGTPAAPEVETAAPDVPEPGPAPEVGGSPGTGGEPVGGFDVGSAPAAEEPAGFEPGGQDFGGFEGTAGGAAPPAEEGLEEEAGGPEDWVIEREPEVPGSDSLEVEPMETVESAQDTGYFGGPGEGIETTAPPTPETPEQADTAEDLEMEAEPMVTGGFETGGGDFDIGSPDAGTAPPETAATPEAGGAGTQEVVPETDIQPEEHAAEEGRAPEALPTPTQQPQGFQFGKRDPHEKARRLARVLVSDMIMYNPERHTRALEQGSLEADFEDEISKSWEEYVDQVGDEIANGTNYFNEALNDILAKGQEVFHGRHGQ